MNKRFRYTLTLLVFVGAAALAGGVVHAQTSTLPADLRGTTWTLMAINPAGQAGPDISGLGITLRFADDGLASGTSTCNSYSSPAQAGTESALTFGPILSTLRACVDPDRMTLETTYFTALKSVSAYAIQGNRLQLTYDNGQSTLEFTGTTAPGMPVTGTPTLALALAFAAGALLLVAGGLSLRRGWRPLA